jgi:long-subunit acyl-CoA synthetase (AMP-forming)
MRGPFVMVGYYKNEELSNQTLRGDGCTQEIKVS